MALWQWVLFILIFMWVVLPISAHMIASAIVNGTFNARSKWLAKTQKALEDAKKAINKERSKWPAN